MFSWEGSGLASHVCYQSYFLVFNQCLVKLQKDSWEEEQGLHFPSGLLTPSCLSWLTELCGPYPTLNMGQDEFPQVLYPTSWANIFLLEQEDSSILVTVTSLKAESQLCGYRCLILPAGGVAAKRTPQAELLSWFRRSKRVILVSHSSSSVNQVLDCL